MDKTYTLIALYDKEYAFDKNGMHYEGVTAHAVFLIAENGKNTGIHDCKISKDAPALSVGSRGKSLLCDQFGRFVRFG